MNQSFIPALNDTLFSNFKDERLFALIARIEFTAVEEFTRVVNCDFVAFLRLRTTQLGFLICFDHDFEFALLMQDLEVFVLSLSLESKHKHACH